MIDLNFAPESQISTQPVPPKVSVPHENWSLIKPYLDGVYAPTKTETIEPLALKVIGTIPEEISGSYVRNGPNPKYGGFKKHHWFDGDGMLHKISINEGKATYQNRYIRTHGLANEDAKSKKLFAGLNEVGETGSVLKSALLGIRNSINQFDLSTRHAGRIMKDTANTDVILFRGKLIPLWWLSGTPFALDPKTLETTGIETFGGTYHGEMAAHARIDETTGDLFFLNFGQLFKYVTVNRVGADGKLKWSEKFDLPYARIYHDVLFTKDYVVLLDFPMGFIKEEGTGKPIIGFDRTSKHGHSRVVLINRENPKIQKSFTFDASYVLHGLNAYQENDSVVMFMTKFTDPVVTHQNDADRIPKVGILRVETVTARWELNLTTNKFSETIVDDTNTEFARINDTYLAKKSQYSYHPTLREEPTVNFDGLMKLNFQTGQKTHLKYGPNLIGEEPSFIPKAHAKAEDDGYLGTFVHDRTTLETEYRIYDAGSFDNEPIARIQIPKDVKVPYGFHSKWLPGV